MLKYFLGLVSGIVLVFLAVVLFAALALSYRQKPPEITANSTLVLRLSGDVPEKASLDVPGLPAILGGGGASLTVANVWTGLQRAASDSRIRALVVQPEGLAAGWAKLEEFRSGIERFRRSGKPVYFYLRNPSTRDYYVALAATRIYLGPEEPLYLKGLRSESMYFKKTLDKLGASIEVEHAGKYKDYGDMFTRSDMSPETREVTTALVDTLFADIVEHVAAARHKSPAEVRALIDRGPFTASRALAEGLVDRVSFEDQMWGDLARESGAPSQRKVSFEQYLKAAPAPAATRTIALIVGDGDITRGKPGDDAATSSGITSFGWSKLLRQVASDSTIQGAIIRINSPGGEVGASDEIWREMSLLSKKKPIVFSMSDMAASGGYYIALTGDPIVAAPGTFTGSIGVVFGKANLRGLYEKLGVTKDSIQRGRHADIDSDYTPLNPEERQLLRDGIDESYQAFVTKVAEARRRSFSDIEPKSQGRVWLGSQALEQGLVDQLGGLDTALAALKKKAGIPPAEPVTILTYPAGPRLLDYLVHRTSTESMLHARLREVFGLTPFEAWMHGGYLRLMPYSFSVR
jgi:protease IV